MKWNASQFSLVLIAIILLAQIAPAQSTQPTSTRPSVTEMLAQHDKLAQKYGTPSGGVAIGKMSPSELDDYMAGEKFLAQQGVFGQITVTPTLDLSALPSPGKLTGNDPAATAKDSRLLAESDSWRTIAFQTLTILPVPKGWEVYEAGYNTHLYFPPIEMRPTGKLRSIKASDVVQINLSVPTAEGMDEAYSQAKKSLEPLIQQSVAECGEEHLTSNRAGYFLILAKQTQAISISICAPIPGHEGKLFAALITMDKSKWNDAAPVLTAMFQHWYDFEGHLLLPNFRIDLSANDCRMAGIEYPSKAHPLTELIASEIPDHGSLSPTEQLTNQTLLRHNQLALKYSTISRGVEVARMSDAEFEDYIAGEQILDERRLLGKEVMPANISLDGLPEPGNLCSDDAAGTAWGAKTVTESGHWRDIAFQTQSILPVPTGWEVHEGKFLTDLYFPALKMGPDGPARPTKMIDVIHANLLIRKATGIDEVYTAFKKETLSSPMSIDVGDEHKLGDRAGYCLLSASQQQAIILTLVAPRRDDDGYCHIATVTLHKSKWPAAAPLLTAMFQRWTDFKGNPLLPGFHMELSADEQRMTQLDYSPATRPAAQASTTEPAVYTSKLGNFTCPVPQLLDRGGPPSDQASDGYAVVSFSDDIGTLLRIESIKIPAEQSAAFVGAAAPKTFDAFFDRSLMPNEFKAVSPDASILARENVDTAAGPALFVTVSIPGGSTLMDHAHTNPPRRMDSVRGVLIFRQKDFLYVISNQESPFAEDIVKKTAAERADLLNGQLQQIVAGMTFH